MRSSSFGFASKESYLLVLSDELRNFGEDVGDLLAGLKVTYWLTSLNQIDAAAVTMECYRLG